MSKTRDLNSLAGLFLLILAVAGSSACSFGSVTAQKPARDSETAAAAAAPPTSTSTPAYKPPKRVSRDVLDSDKKAAEKDDAAKIKIKK